MTREERKQELKEYWDDFFRYELFGRSKQEWHDARLNSDNWYECACATLPDRLLDGYGNMPQDFDLRWLGIEFARAVRYKKLRKARALYKKIRSEGDLYNQL